MESSVMVSEEVFEAKIASGFTILSSSAYVSRFTWAFSMMASMTMSQSARSVRLVVGFSRPRAASRSAAGSVPFSTNLPSDFWIPANPLSRNFCSTSRTTVS